MQYGATVNEWKTLIPSKATRVSICVLAILERSQPDGNPLTDTQLSSLVESCGEIGNVEEFNRLIMLGFEVLHEKDNSPSATREQARIPPVSPTWKQFYRGLFVGSVSFVFFNNINIQVNIQFFNDNRRFNSRSAIDTFNQNIPNPEDDETPANKK